MSAVVVVQGLGGSSCSRTCSSWYTVRRRSSGDRSWRSSGSSKAVYGATIGGAPGDASKTLESWQSWLHARTHELVQGSVGQAVGHEAKQRTGKPEVALLVVADGGGWRWEERAGRQLEMGQVSGPGKSLSPFLFSFLIF